MDKHLRDCLSDNFEKKYIFPFFWQHGESHEVLKEEMDAEVSRLQVLIDALDTDIEKLQKDQRELGVPVTIPTGFLDKHTELTHRISALTAQNNAREKSQTLIADVKAAKQALADVEQDVLLQIQNMINEQMVHYNNRIYRDQYAPVINIESNKKYTFTTPNDDGMETGYKSICC